jgi:hypothetical protein
MAYTNIDDPSAYFQTKLWTGNGSTSTGITITNDGNSDLQPDLIWNKQRTTASHGLWDSSRGISRSLTSENVNAEQYNAGKGITSFNTNGFTGVREGWVQFNRSAEPYVAWQWKANGGTTSTDTTSSITSTVQVNSDAGFSIVTYTGDGTTTGGFGHGLGVAPKVVFVKRRNAAANWCVYHESIGAGFYLQLNTTAAQQSGPWQNLAPNSTTVIVYGGGLVNGNGDTYVAYCFAEKQGYSKFGKYVGNGNTNGPFVYTGFKPAVIIHKSITTTKNWGIITGGTFENEIDARLNPNLSAAEGTGTMVDFLSNGFKWRTTNGTANTNGATYIYMAFAENPFTTSTGIPTTAR